MQATDCPEVSGYDADLCPVIKRKIEAELEASRTTDGRMACEWSDSIVRLGDDEFAVFGGDAYKLLPLTAAHDGGMEFEYLPALVSGRAFRMTPDEGPGGVMYATRCTRGVLAGRGWATVYLDGNWCKASDLESAP